MGTIDPPIRRAPDPKPAVHNYGITGIGGTAISIGAILIVVCLVFSFNIPGLIIGGILIFAGMRTRTVRLCPDCRLETPPGASVCGHCRAVLVPGS
jgi:hypothetical protein